MLLLHSSKRSNSDPLISFSHLYLLVVVPQELLCSLLSEFLRHLLGIQSLVSLCTPLVYLQLFLIIHLLFSLSPRLNLLLHHSRFCMRIHFFFRFHYDRVMHEGLRIIYAPVVLGCPVILVEIFELHLGFLHLF